MAFDPDAYIAKKTAFNPDAYLANRQVQTSIKDEMPEWLDPDDRTIVKNLANSPEEIKKYLQKKYPDAEIQTPDGDVLLRKKGEVEFRKLDPSFSPISNTWGTLKDVWNDTKDVAYDVAQGGAEALGALGGGAAGTLAAPGVGTTAGAIAGGAAASGTLSALKEKLAAELGVREFDGTNVAKDAAISAAIPVAFKGLGQAWRGAKYVAPKAYSWATGLDQDVLSTIAKNGDEIAKKTDSELLGTIRGAQDDASKWVRSTKGEFGQRMNQIKDGSGEIDATDLVKLFGDEIAQATGKADGFASPANLEEIKAIQEMQSYLLPEGFQGGKIDLARAIDLKHQAKNRFMPDFGEQVTQGVGSGNGIQAQQRRFAKKIQELIDNKVNNETWGAGKAFADDYSKFAKQTELLDKLNSEGGAETFLNQLQKGNRKSLSGGVEDLPEQLRKALKNRSNELYAARALNPQSALDKSIMGKTPLTMALQNGGALAGSIIGGGPAAGFYTGAAGRIIGNAVTSPWAVRKITKNAARVNMKMEALKELVEQYPQLLPLLYGGAASVTE